MMRTGQQLSIVSPLTVVEVFSNGEYGVVQRIPQGSIVRHCGQSKLRTMVNIEWHQQLYSAFEQDIAERTAPLNAPARSGPRREERGSRISFQWPGA